jgi:alkanesulfonate monooxygenase SsuD/methylene tetrahydromethanopterin reductase-like flavin-dependent oxidoreductase (luciferase family)
MVLVSLYVEGQDGLTWPRWKSLIAHAEALGFNGLYRSDHFTNTDPPDKDRLELIVSLSYLGSFSQRLRFGPLVAPMSFRHPSLLALQAIALDELSNGRLTLGIGAGWQQREHALFGYHLGDVRTAFARLQEGLEVLTLLLRQDEPAYFEGTHYRLQGARLLPRPRGPHETPILIGGNGIRKLLPLVAQYGDIWNGVFLSPVAFRERLMVLDSLLIQRGRRPDDVRRTLLCQLHYALTLDELDDRLSWRYGVPDLAHLSLKETIAALRTPAWGNRLIGTSDMIIEQIQAYDLTRLEEIMVVWADLDDTARLRSFAETIVPYIKTVGYLR